MSEDIRRLPVDDEDEEEWERLSDDPGRRRVSVVGNDSDGWQVTVWAMELLYEFPVGHELGQRLVTALQSLDGVDGVHEVSRESWDVMGGISGRLVAQAAAQVVDGLASEIRSVLDSDGNVR